jgi:hypothetical protein
MDKNFLIKDDMLKGKDKMGSPSKLNIKKLIIIIY